MSWLTWLLLALIPVAPVVLLLFADDRPKNDYDADEPARQDGDGPLILAA